MPFKFRNPKSLNRAPSQCHAPLFSNKYLFSPKSVKLMIVSWNFMLLLCIKMKYWSLPYMVWCSFTFQNGNMTQDGHNVTFSKNKLSTLEKNYLFALIIYKILVNINKHNHRQLFEFSICSQCSLKMIVTMSRDIVTIFD